MPGHKKAKGKKGAATEGRRCNFTIISEMDIKLSAWARKHKVTRSKAANEAIALLVKGTRIGFPGEEGSEAGAAA